MSAILILDDDFALASEWRRHLVAIGHEVDLSHTSSEALALDATRDHDVFIVDLVIRMDAVEISDSGAVFLRHLMQRFRRSGKTPPIIGVSGFRPLGTEVPVMDFFDAYGVENFLLKPFPPEELCDRVNLILANADS